MDHQIDGAEGTVPPRPPLAGEEAGADGACACFCCVAGAVGREKRAQEGQLCLSLPRRRVAGCSMREFQAQTRQGRLGLPSDRQRSASKTRIPQPPPLAPGSPKPTWIIRSAVPKAPSRQAPALSCRALAQIRSLTSRTASTI